MKISDMHLYQLLVVAISSVMIYQGIHNFIKKKSGQTVIKLTARIVVWGGMALTAISPSVTLVIARIAGIHDNINAVILTGFMLVFLIIFKLISAIEKIEQNISELIRKDALQQLDRECKK